MGKKGFFKKSIDPLKWKLYDKFIFLRRLMEILFFFGVVVGWISIFIFWACSLGKAIGSISNRFFFDESGEPANYVYYFYLSYYILYFLTRE